MAHVSPHQRVVAKESKMRSDRSECKGQPCYVLLSTSEYIFSQLPPSHPSLLQHRHFHKASQHTPPHSLPDSLTLTTASRPLGDNQTVDQTVNSPTTTQQIYDVCRTQSHHPPKQHRCRRRWRCIHTSHTKQQLLPRRACSSRARCKRGRPCYAEAKAVSRNVHCSMLCNKRMLTGSFDSPTNFFEFSLGTYKISNVRSI